MQLPNLKQLTTFTGILLITGLLLQNCSKNNSNQGVKPASILSISSISVNTGPYNTQVVITGGGFSITPTDDNVYFNGKPSIVTAASQNSITTSVPLGSGTGAVTIILNGKTATGPIFTYQQEEVVTIFAGSSLVGSANGIGTLATFNNPTNLVSDLAGNIYVTDQGNNLIRKITPGGGVSTFAGNGNDNSKDGNSTTASFSTPTGITLDQSGNIYVSDIGSSLIRKITQSGVVTTFAGNGRHQAIDGTGTSAGFSNPYGLTVDGSGNIYVADQGAGLIRKINISSGAVTTIFGNGNRNINTYNLVLDKSGNIYAADVDDNNIVKINSNGIASVFAGNSSISGGFINGTGTMAAFYMPFGLTIDNKGNIYVTDRSNTRIREITPSEIVTSFAGGGSFGFEGPALSVFFGNPIGISIDPNGNIFVTDGNEIKKISLQ